MAFFADHSERPLRSAFTRVSQIVSLLNCESKEVVREVRATRFLKLHARNRACNDLLVWSCVVAKVPCMLLNKLQPHEVRDALMLRRDIGEVRCLGAGSVDGATLPPPFSFGLNMANMNKCFVLARLWCNACCRSST